MNCIELAGERFSELVKEVYTGGLFGDIYELFPVVHSEGSPIHFDFFSSVDICHSQNFSFLYVRGVKLNNAIPEEVTINYL